MDGWKTWIFRMMDRFWAISFLYLCKCISSFVHNTMCHTTRLSVVVASQDDGTNGKTPLFLPSLAAATVSVVRWEVDEHMDRTTDGTSGLEARSIMTGHFWAYTTRDFLACWKKAWGTRERNGQRRTTTSIFSYKR